jgi:hypothetical protein
MNGEDDEEEGRFGENPEGGRGSSEERWFWQTNQQEERKKSSYQQAYEGRNPGTDKRGKPGAIDRYPWEPPWGESTFQQKPFIRKGAYHVEQGRDITLITHVTLDRLNRLTDLVLSWEGPISAAVYLRHGQQELDQLLQVYDYSPPLLYYVDLHVLYANQTRYPANVLRNMAIRHARSRLIFTLDIDFVTGQEMHARLKQSISHSQFSHLFNQEMFDDDDERQLQKTFPKKQDNQILINSKEEREKEKEKEKEKEREQEREQEKGNDKKGKTKRKANDKEKRNELIALVIPAFESDLTWPQLPANKGELLVSIAQQTVLPVNEGRCPKCHGPTNYQHWFKAKKPYLAHYHWIYEPYLVLLKTPQLPLFEERLKGYGFDKNFHAYHLALAGYQFWVLPDQFVVHVNHPSTSWDGPSHHEQQWDSLMVVCHRFPLLRAQYGFSPRSPVFDEPEESICYSDLHW